MDYIQIIAPHDGKIISELPLATPKSLEEILEKGNTIAKKKPLDKVQRIEILEKTCSILNNKKEALAMQAAQEGGKPFVDSLVEIERGLQGIKVAIQTLSSLTGSHIPMGHTKNSQNRIAFTIREPIGLVLAISAFNHPFNLVIHQVIPAIAVGCPVIIKPASTTPLSCFSIINTLQEAGLPKEWCQIALCKGKDAEIMVQDTRIKFLSFIGSSSIGWHLKSLLKPGVGCALEHGGVAPSIVLEDTDINNIIPNLSRGAFYHAGQVCVSLQRLFVPKKQEELIAKKIYQYIKNWKNGDPTEKDTLIGPLINHKETLRIENWINQSKASCDKVFGGKKLSESHYQASILLNPSQNSIISQKEIFGPALCIYGYEKLNDAITQANSLDFCFQASAFGKDIDKLYYCAKKLKATAVMLNDHTAYRVDWMPFGGREKSGEKLGGIPHTMKDLYEEKTIILNSPSLYE